jgi:hypothetical protein
MLASGLGSIGGVIVTATSSQNMAIEGTASLLGLRSLNQNILHERFELSKVSTALSAAA